MGLNLRNRPKSRISIKINPESINKSYRHLYDNDTPTQIIYGGSSSGKSYAIAQNVTLWALQGRNILIARQVARTIKKSVFNEISKSISNMGLSKYFNINKTDMVITSKLTNGSIIFLGCDDEEKVKSVTPPKASAFDVLWCEESTEISEATFNQLQLRMRGKSKYKKKTILTFNPIYESHWIYKRWFVNKVDNVLILKTTYKDNKYLDSSEIKILEDMKNFSPYHYDVYALGNFGVLGHRVYENWEERHFNIEDLNLPVYMGGDFGYSIDPAVVIYCKYDATNKTIYIFDEVYKKKLTNNLLADEIKAKNKTNRTEAVEIFFDSSEPKSIQELRNYGIRASRATKGPDSILKGIDWLLQHKIIVHPRCKHTLEELKLYVRQEKNGEVQTTPVDKNNHLMDSLRYATCTLWHKSGKVVGYSPDNFYG